MSTQRWGKVHTSVACDSRLKQDDLRTYIGFCLFADKQGRCRPKRHQVADIIGLRLPNISRSTSRLVQFGHMRKVGKGGRSRPAEYVLTAFENGISPDTVYGCQKGINSFEGLGPANDIPEDTVYGRKGISPDTRTEQSIFRHGTETSRRQEEPSRGQDDQGISLASVVDLYHELLPSLPKAKIAAAAAADFASLIEEYPKARNADWWRKYFVAVGQSEFLMKVKRTPPNLPWLVRFDNVAKVLNGDFHDRKAPRRPEHRLLRLAVDDQAQPWDGAI